MGARVADVSRLRRVAIGDGVPRQGDGVTRRRPLVHISLSPDAIARLDEMATRCGETRSGMVEKLVRETEMPRPRTGYATRTTGKT